MIALKNKLFFFDIKFFYLTMHYCNISLIHKIFLKKLNLIFCQWGKFAAKNIKILKLTIRALRNTYYGTSKARS